MSKKVNRDREKILSKADIKANNILKAVEAYEAEDSDLSMRRAAALFHCSSASISNHINARKDVQYMPDLAVEYQKLTPIEETALKDHIHDCFQSGLSLTPKLLREYANELCRTKGDDKEVGKNWHLGFYERHTSVKSKYARSMTKERVSNEDADNYIAWFRLYESIVAKWNILSADTHNMDESGCAIGISHKSRVIVPAKEKEAIKSMDGKREWATSIDTISGIGTASKGFFITKGKSVLRDLMSFIVESGCTIAVTDNGWSNDMMAMSYIKHFNKHTEPIGDYRLLILDGHGSHAIFQFRKYAHDNRIILLYLPAHTTHKLQPLDIGIFRPQANFYSQEIDQYSQ